MHISNESSALANELCTSLWSSMPGCKQLPSFSYEVATQYYYNLKLEINSNKSIKHCNFI